jgi:hypothetical protein
MGKRKEDVAQAKFDATTSFRAVAEDSSDLIRGRSSRTMIGF